MTSFELSLSPQVLFGAGCVSRLGEAIKPHARRVLLLSSGSPARIRKALDSIKQAGLSVVEAHVKGEPTLDAVRSAVRVCSSSRCEAVAAVGGGSVLDAGKAVAAMAANPGDLLDYLEVVGEGKVLPKPPLFLAAVPTTAGTGTEATRNAVLTSTEHRVKVSLRHPSLVPKVVLLDPELTYSMPPDVTAATGMDALCQLIEAYTCLAPNPFTDALCREGLTRAARSLRKAFFEGGNFDAREDMVLASHFSGVALANAKLGAVHGFAAPLGGMYDAMHGALCAALLPAVTAANLKALRERAPGSPALGRYDGVARIVTGRSDAVGDDAVVFCEALRRDLGVPRLQEQGVKREEFALVCGKAAKASSMKGNPVELTMGELAAILEKAY